MRTRLETENWKSSPYTQYLGLQTWMSSSRNQINQKREDSPDLGSKVFQHEEVKPKRWNQSRKLKRSGQCCKRGTPQREFKMGGQPCQTSLRWKTKGRQKTWGRLEGQGPQDPAPFQQCQQKLKLASKMLIFFNYFSSVFSTKDLFASKPSVHTERDW